MISEILRGRSIYWKNLRSMGENYLKGAYYMKSISRISSLILLLVLSVMVQCCIGMDDIQENNHGIAEAGSVPVGDINIAYRIQGQGEPVVLIMGYGSTMDLWDPHFLENLSSEYRVIVFDNRGMGDTTAPPGNFSISQFANDTAGLMTALGIKGPCAGLVHGVVRGSGTGHPPPRKGE